MPYKFVKLAVNESNFVPRNEFVWKLKFENQPLLSSKNSHSSAKTMERIRKYTYPYSDKNY